MKLLALFFALTILISSSKAKVWVVNNAGPGDFASAQAAHNAASTGDTLMFVGSSVGYGNLVMRKRLVLIGNGYFHLENNIAGYREAARFARITLQGTLDHWDPAYDQNSGASGSTLVGMSAVHIDILVNNLTIDRCRVESSLSGLNYIAGNRSGIVITRSYIGQLTGLTNSTVTNCIVVSDLYSVVNSVVSHCDLRIDQNFGNRPGVDNTVFRNNIIWSGSPQLWTNSDPNNVRNNVCLFSAPDPDNTQPDVHNGINNIFGQSVLTIYGRNSFNYDGRYSLAGGSPAIGAGENGSTCGAFGGSSRYILSGIPPVPLIYELTVPNTPVTSQSGLPVQIKVKVQN